MARWLELADGGSTKYTTRTRVSAVAAGGAMVLASLVAATTTASAEDPGTLSRDLSAAPSVEPSTTVVAGLIVEYAGRSSRLSQAAGAASAMGVSASVTARDEGVGVITFDETADVASAEKVAKRVERLPGVSSVELNVLH
ncbi:MAG: hypothetical protein GX593_01910, partial [Actinomycetales bacterium]|nr:hypothetical protein [Actinomycetales bacterium]